MSEHLHRLTPLVANVTDVGLGAVGLGAYWNYLPEAAAALTVLWYLGRFAAAFWKFAIFVKRLAQRDRAL